MATPFDDEGRLDLDGAARLARALVASGSDGLVVTGSTGEAPTLSDEERLALWGAVTEAVSVPVLAGSTSNDTPHSIALTKAASALPIAGVLAVTPYYNRPPQAGLEAHFLAVAAATPLPVILYDVPARTGRRLARRTIVRCAQQAANIVGLKDAAGDPAATERVLAEVPTGFECYSGDDALTLPLLAVGAVGLIGVATHWAAAEYKEMIVSFLAGERDRPRAIGRALLASTAFETSDDAPNPLPVKAMLRVMGLPAGQCRLPLGVAPDGLEQQAKSVLAELDHWRSQRGHRG